MQDAAASQMFTLSENYGTLSGNERVMVLGRSWYKSRVAWAVLVSLLAWFVGVFFRARLGGESVGAAILYGFGAVAWVGFLMIACYSWERFSERRKQQKRP